MTHSLRFGFLIALAFVLSTHTPFADEASPKIASRWLGVFAKKPTSDLIGPDVDRDGFASLETLVGAPLSDEAIARIESVVTRQPLYRHLPTQTVQCNPALIAFCVAHPDFVVALWERLGMTELTTREIATDEGEVTSGGRYTLTESTGTCATVDRLYITQSPRSGLCLVGIRGTYRGPFSEKDIDGESLLLFRWQVDEEAADTAPKVICRLDAFIAIHNAAAKKLAKMLVPIIGKIADSNFEQTILFAGGLHEAIISDAETIREIVYRLPTLRREVRRDFGRLLDDPAFVTDTPQQARADSTTKLPF